MDKNKLEEKMSYRFLKVLRIAAYVPFPFIYLIGLFDVGRDYHYGIYTWNFQGAFLWSIFSTLIYILIVESVYKAIFYILFGKKK